VCAKEARGALSRICPTCLARPRQMCQNTRDLSGFHYDRRMVAPKSAAGKRRIIELHSPQASTEIAAVEPRFSPAWFAGYWEADGSASFCLCKRKLFKHLLRVTSTDIYVLEQFQKRYGGRVAYRKDSNLEHLPRADWVLANQKKMAAFLWDILPHLSLSKKGRIARISLEVVSINNGTGYRLTENERARRLKLLEKIKVLRTHVRRKDRVLQA